MYEQIINQVSQLSYTIKTRVMLQGHSSNAHDPQEKARDLQINFKKKETKTITTIILMFQRKKQAKAREKCCFLTSSQFFSL